ncbi:MAG TPA: hypothetical protein VLI71_18845 [Gammaproteobacteria bacterium]|nr:hypothetical protein [Gammaproteobacteria bacterium]
MPEEKTVIAPHWLRFGVWALFVAAFAFLYYRYSSLFGTELTELAASSVWLAYAVYVFLGALRGFALIPVTNLVVLAIPLFQPVPLLVLTLVGIAISSACIYAFAGSLKLGEYLERKHVRHMDVPLRAESWLPASPASGTDCRGKQRGNSNTAGVQAAKRVIRPRAPPRPCTKLATPTGFQGIGLDFGAGRLARAQGGVCADCRIWNASSKNGEGCRRVQTRSHEAIPTSARPHRRRHARLRRHRLAVAVAPEHR